MIIDDLTTGGLDAFARVASAAFWFAVSLCVGLFGFSAWWLA